MNYSIRYSYLAADARNDRRTAGTRMITAESLAAARALAETMRADLDVKSHAQRGTFRLDDVVAFG